MGQFAVKLLMLVFLIGAVSPTPCGGAEQGLKTIGIRAGLSATPKHEFFRQYEAYAVYALPWDWRADSGLGVALQLNTAAGVLRGGGKYGFIGSIGPGLSIDKPGCGLSMDVGGSAAILSRRVFGSQDFNGMLQFMAHAGLNYRFDSGPGISYRFQHMSNGHIYPGGNPGLDLHMVSLSWNF